MSNFDSSFTKLHAVDSPVDYQLSPATQQRFAGFSFTRSPMLGPAPPQ